MYIKTIQIKHILYLSNQWFISSELSSSLDRYELDPMLEPKNKVKVELERWLHQWWMPKHIVLIQKNNCQLNLLYCKTLADAWSRSNSKWDVCVWMPVPLFIACRVETLRSERIRLRELGWIFSQYSHCKPNIRALMIKEITESKWELDDEEQNC